MIVEFFFQYRFHHPNKQNWSEKHKMTKNLDIYTSLFYYKSA